MPNSKSYLKAIRILRILSLVNLSFSLAAFFIHTGVLLSVLLSISANVSMSILLMAPDTYIDGRTPVRCGIASVSMSAFVWTMLVIQSIRNKLCMSVLLLPVAATVPLAVCLILRSSSMMDDVPYLTMGVSGWEILLDNNKMNFIVGSWAIMSFVTASVLYPSTFGRVLSGIVAALSLFLYVIMLIRSVTSGPVIGYTDDGRPYGEKDVETSAYIREKPRMNVLMYNKICQYLEDSRPYLDPEYSLENLARELISNKSYVSRVINEASGLNFCQLMNRYRVNFAKEMFHKNPDLKLKELSELSGFNSQVTFNMAFKLFCDTTPGVWCKECRDSLRAKSRLSRTEARGQRPPQAFSVQDE